MFLSSPKLGLVPKLNHEIRSPIAPIPNIIVETIHQVREKTEEFLDDYNNYHPHDSLNDMSPIEFMKVKNQTKMSNFIL